MDSAGLILPVTDSSTGQVRVVQIFKTALEASQVIRAMAQRVIEVSSATTGTRPDFLSVISMPREMGQWL